MLPKTNSTLKRFIDVFNPSNERGGDERDDQANIFKQRKARIEQLPHELLLLIGSCLSSVSQACLALTCRTFFCITGEVLGSREFDLPCWLGWGFPYSSFYYRPSLRWELLCLLEDARWLLCSSCIKLHRVNMFPLCSPAGSRSIKCAKRWYFVSSYKECVVEICPCIRMSLRDKLKLMAQLKAERGKACNPSVWHQCLATGSREKILIQAQPILRKGNLIFQMRYEIRADVPFRSLHLWDSPIFYCCQNTTTSYKVLGNLEAPSSELEWVRQPSGSQHFILCIRCRTTVGDFTIAENSNEKIYTFQTTRNLGKARWLADDFEWNYQSSSLAGEMVKYGQKPRRDGNTDHIPLWHSILEAIFTGANHITIR
jgi:hypothetical protein